MHNKMHIYRSFVHCLYSYMKQYCHKLSRSKDGDQFTQLLQFISLQHNSHYRLIVILILFYSQMNFEHDTIKLVKIQDQYPLNSTLLTLNDKLGLVASCSECTFTVSFIDDPSQSTTTSTTSTSTGDALIKHMQFNANNTLLYICTDKHLSAYSCLLLMVPSVTFNSNE